MKMITLNEWIEMYFKTEEDILQEENDRTIDDMENFLQEATVQIFQLLPNKLYLRQTVAYEGDSLTKNFITPDNKTLAFNEVLKILSQR